MNQGTLTSRTGQAHFNLKEIIAGEWVEAHFQPIVSLKRRGIVGLEGLIRGLYPKSRDLISPMDLFHPGFGTGTRPALPQENYGRFPASPRP